MEINDFIGKKMITWIWKNPHRDTFLFAKPQFVNKGAEGWVAVELDDFPTEGSIMVYPQSGYTADDILHQYGSFVLAKLNVLPRCKEEERNWYSAKCKPDMQSGMSEFEIERFSVKGFYQVISTYKTYDSVVANRGFEYNGSQIFTNEILIKTIEDYYFGPFTYDKKEGFIALSANVSRQYMIGRFDKTTLQEKWLSIYNSEDNFLQYNFYDESDNNLFALSYQNYDWISDDKILEGFAKTLRVANSTFIYTKDQIRKIKDTISEVMEIHCGFEMTEPRQKRLEELLNAIEDHDEFFQKITYYILENPAISTRIIEIVCESHFDKIEEKLKEITEVKENIIHKKKELETLQEQINNLASSRSAITQEVLVAENAEITRLNEEIATLSEKREELAKMVDLGRSISELTAEKESLQRRVYEARAENERQIADKARLDDQLNSTLNTFRDQSKAIAKALDSKLLDRVLRAVGGEEFNEEYSQAPFDSSLLATHHDAEQIIGLVAGYIRDQANRSVTDNDIINYLICMTQGFITTFAGEPGTGKTSLCSILSKSLGLSRSDEYNRFVEVSVERGWTSHKDYIGYFNPLTKSLEHSNIDVFTALCQLDAEARTSGYTAAPFIILLDEANLSPIEHYWAAFLKNCDAESSSSRAINLGGKYVWRIPENLRFFATVNFDHTTEELSPRFLDRSWVIMLEPEQINDETINSVEVVNNDNVLSFDNLLAAFDTNQSYQIDDLIATKWNNIQRIFRTCGLQIMPRNLKMVRNYCMVACHYMSRDSVNEKFAPLDYAVAQKILPTINGSGENYKKLVEELLVECSGMPLCHRHLTRIFRVATENMGFYQFFGKR